jgi:hypothetical protein
VAKTAPPGWYADPGNVSLVRWWDGSQWTTQTHPAPDQPTSSAAIPPAALTQAALPGVKQRPSRSQVWVIGVTWLWLAGLWIVLFIVAAALDRDHTIPAWVKEPLQILGPALLGLGFLWIVRWLQAKRLPPGSR